MTKHIRRFLAVLPCILFPAAAFAQEAGAPSGGLLDLLWRGEVLATIAGVVLGVLGGLIGNDAIRRRRIALAIHHAYAIAEDVARETEGPDGFDKAAAGLRAADAWMVANGWRALRPGEQEVAKLGFSAIHGAEIARAKTQALSQHLAERQSAPPAQPSPQ